MRQLIVKIILFSTLFLSVVFGIFDPYIYGDTRFRETLEDLKKYNKDEVDIVYCGSSKVFTALNPAIIDEKLQTTSFNLATGSQNLETTAFFLENFLKIHNPRLLVLDVSPADNYLLNAPGVQPFQLEVFDNLPFSEKKYEHLIRNYGFNNIINLVSPTIRNHNDWDDKLIRRRKFYKEKGNAYVRGYYNNDESFSNPNANYGNYKEEFKEFNTYRFEYIDGLEKLPKKVDSLLQRIYTIASESNTNLVLVSIPYLSWYKDKNGDYLEYSSSIKTLANRLEIKYIDLNTHYDTLNLQFSDFKDVAHLNSKGASKVSLFLAKTLKEDSF
jgi:lysophospholipase L1-like esterase